MVPWRRLTGLRRARASFLFVGLFGPRGLSSFVFLIIGLEGLEQAGVDPGPFGVTVAWTVLLSVVAHGLTAAPLAARYGRRVAMLTETTPEHEPATETQPAHPWAGDARTDQRLSSR
jgi:NhaP-type Na+/H+ or K+/H+ antiporter